MNSYGYTNVLSLREQKVLEAYSSHLLQIKFPATKQFIQGTLAKKQDISKLLINFFLNTFDPTKDSNKEAEKIKSEIKLAINEIQDKTEAKVIEKIFEVMQHTLRTNYFQEKDYISIKINSKALTEMPLPKPNVEIFVYHDNMEGVHLRSAKLSRGGIRWSDRADDYRTEILGLMKTQVAKNSIIVPSGAKGGFILKNAERFTGNREELSRYAIECYKTLIRGMLDITDNVINEKIVKPKKVKCLDQDDPYLVVAADKGTSTFSDIANKLAIEEYNFWLNDAFASGGSAGYDHKKIGITARGAWISVEEHFKKLGLDPNKDAFTAIGIGDMSGDVFGNGMLLSKSMKLVAAFNHIHIFLDPNPTNPEASYKERLRLFNQPRSNWTDYDKNLISSGGGVFDSKAESINISKEVKELLDINQDTLKPDQLIQFVLKAKVDLLWNGGIGTYVKSSKESNKDASDKSNDNLRVNGEDLRCRAIAEGGNLGFTQAGRIEYAFNGGLINTDSIDNSGGVDCSDHEVNIKIAFIPALESGKILRDQRNKLLLDMTDEVAELVLHDNVMQNQELSISSEYSNTSMESYKKLIEILKESMYLDPVLEFLPSEAEIDRRIKSNLGLSRPELAVLMSYSKRAVYSNLIDSGIAQDPYYEKMLFEYFPSQMHEIFKDEIIKHRLKEEIITTSIANAVVNSTGSYFVHLAAAGDKKSYADVARAYSAIVEAFHLKTLEEEVNAKYSDTLRIDLFHSIREFLKRAILYVLEDESQSDIEALIRELSEENKAVVLEQEVSEKIALLGVILTRSSTSRHTR